MKYNVDIIENLTLKRPSVLLVGNGILQAVTNAKWSETIKEINKMIKEHGGTTE